MPRPINPDNRNADLDEGLGGQMFSGIVTGAQNHFTSQMRMADELRNLQADTTDD